MDKVYNIKSKNQIGILMIPSKNIDIYGHKSLNNVYLEDGTTVMVRDDDLEELNDRPAEIEE